MAWARRWGILAVLLAATTAVCGAEGPAAEGPAPWLAVGRIAPEALRECSGVVESRRRPGVFWTHGDSGTDPRLVAVDPHGAVVAAIALTGAPNTDWEDICADDAGHLYIGDIGNSGGLFPARYVYKLAEPDPQGPPDEPAAPLERWRFRYPEGARFNSEGLFWHAGALYVLPRTVGTTIVYRLDPVGDGDAELTSVATLHVGSATGAEVSADGTRLLVCTPMAVWVFPMTGDERFIDPAGGKRVTYPGNGAIEACCFAGDDVVLIAENGSIYRVSAEQVEHQVRFVRPR